MIYIDAMENVSGDASSNWQYFCHIENRLPVFFIKDQVKLQHIFGFNKMEENWHYFCHIKNRLPVSLIVFQY